MRGSPFVGNLCVLDSRQFVQIASERTEGRIVASKDPRLKESDQGTHVACRWESTGTIHGVAMVGGCRRWSDNAENELGGGVLFFVPPGEIHEGAPLAPVRHGISFSLGTMTVRYILVWKIV